MIEVKNIEIFNFEGALRGMRNPLASWDKSDSKYCIDLDIDCDNCPLYPCLEAPGYIIGENDLALAKKLVKAGSDESKFMRQILVSMDITAPIYWWKECSTYKVATVANSTSTMHTLTKAPITLDMFSFDDGKIGGVIVQTLEELRQLYLETNDKKVWRSLIQLLPQSFNQTRTWTANYQVLRNIYKARSHHKLSEWRDFCETIESLPYSELIII